MRAVMYGAGNIGRGFIGALLSKSGYAVTFIDVDQEVVRRLNEAGRYPLRTILPDGYADEWITNVNAVNGMDAQKAADTIAQCDIMATAVGTKILPRIAPVIARAIAQRMQADTKPLNIIICENLMDANKVLEKLLKEQLTPEQQARFDAEVGLAEASIGRMVPVQTEQMRDGEALRVCVERYGFLPVDRDAFRGGIPQIASMIPFSPFDFYIRRKLYVHNMGHATCAYLGMYAGHEYIWQAVGQPDIELCVENAMLESMAALIKKYGVETAPLLNHMHDLIGRFANRGLGDTCARVGGDVPRKLAADDRLIGSARLCLDMGIVPNYIALGAAGGVYRYLAEQNLPLTKEEGSAQLQKLSGLTPQDTLYGLIMQHLPLYLAGASLEELRLSAKNKKMASLKDVV